MPAAAAACGAGAAAGATTTSAAAALDVILTLTWLVSNGLRHNVSGEGSAYVSPKTYSPATPGRGRHARVHPNGTQRATLARHDCQGRKANGSTRSTASGRHWLATTPKPEMPEEAATELQTARYEHQTASTHGRKKVGGVPRRVCNYVSNELESLRIERTPADVSISLSTVLRIQN